MNLNDSGNQYTASLTVTKINSSVKPVLYDLKQALRLTSFIKSALLLFLTSWLYFHNIINHKI